VALPKPRQPTKKATGENWIKVRIELESDVPVQPSYEFEVEYKQDIPHALSTIHNNGLSPVCSANALIGGEKYKFRVRVRQGGQEGPWSGWSSALLCQKGRDAIDSELRRKMWADFYTATGEHEETGSRLDQPCLGCRARRAIRPIMLSPLLTNVDASHVIAYSLGGPSGDSPNHSWNFVPLCAPCNRDHQKTKNLIDWLKEEGDKYGDYVPLYEVLIRLRRACVKNGRVNGSSAPPMWLQPRYSSNQPIKTTSYPLSCSFPQWTLSTLHAISIRRGGQICSLMMASATRSPSTVASTAPTRTARTCWMGRCCPGRAGSSPRTSSS